MAKPQIGLSMLYCLGETFDKLLSEIPKTRPMCIELVDDGLHSLDKKKVTALNDVKHSYDKRYTVHAPFVGTNIALPPSVLLNATLRRLKSSILNAAKLECEMWVFHPGMRTATSMFYPGMDWTRNLESVELLYKFAGDRGIEASLENIMESFVMKNVDEFKRFYYEIGENIGVAFDTGHANVMGQVERFLTDFSDKFVHVHAHDNHGKSDEHLGIGYGNIDWNLVATNLKRVSFSKTVIIESVEHIDESIQKMENLLL